MDVFKLMRCWFDFCFENPELINPNHSALYFFCIENCNRLGWKQKFGLPTEMAKEAIGIKNYRTYQKTLSDLIDFGFIKLIKKSQNQYSANVVAIVENTTSHTKALTKAMHQHVQKQRISTASIDIPNTILPNTINNIYDFYPAKCPIKNRSLGKSSTDKKKIEKLLEKYSEEDIINRINAYVEDCINNKSYMKNFKTFLNNLPDVESKPISQTDDFAKSMAISYKEMEREL